jgi:hypothetical protein
MCAWTGRSSRPCTTTPAAYENRSVALDEETAIRSAIEHAHADPRAPAKACRVRRLDREDAFYFIVLIESDPADVVLVDGHTGRVTSTARINPGTSLLATTQHDAATLAGLDPADEAELVWAPCEASRSPFYPFWRIRRGSEVRFVDQRGIVHSRIGAPERRGG